MYEYCNCMDWGVRCLGAFWIFGLVSFYINLRSFRGSVTLSIHTHAHTLALSLSLSHFLLHTLSYSHNADFQVGDRMKRASFPTFS